MPGRLIAVVGPSGVGKDTVMGAMVQACPRLGLVRRVISRPGDAGGEAFDGVDAAAFQRLHAAGHFALSWQAHGLYYGIPASMINDLNEGRDLLVNLSRSVLADAQDQFPGFVTLALTAPPEVLAARLTARGREIADGIAARLKQADKPLPEGLKSVITIANDGPLEATVERALNLLYPEKV